jgi:hypothetical protein
MLSDKQLQQLRDKSTDKPGLLPYPHHIGSAPIKPENTSTFVNRGVSKVNHEFKDRFDRLRQEYESLMEEYEWNKVIYESDLRFEPVIGEIYHLYVRDNKKFISLIGPKEWNQEYLGSFKLNSDLKWEKIK